MEKTMARVMYLEDDSQGDVLTVSEYGAPVGDVHGEDNGQSDVLTVSMVLL